MRRFFVVKADPRQVVTPYGVTSAEGADGVYELDDDEWTVIIKALDRIVSAPENRQALASDKKTLPVRAFRLRQKLINLETRTSLQADQNAKRRRKFVEEVCHS